MSNGSDRSDDSDGIPDDLDAFLGELGVGDESDGSEDHGSPIQHQHLPNSGSSGSLVDSPLLASLGIDLGDIDGGSDSSDDDL